MKNYLLTLAFIGTNYHGYQVQKNAITVAERFQDAVEVVLGTRVDITGCSRTDSGVHANGYCLNLKTDKNITERGLALALNIALPNDISVIDCKEVPMDFHARYSCVKKEYIYKIYNLEYRNPFYEQLALHFPYKIDETLLNQAAKEFIGTYDFKAFSGKKCDLEDTVRTIYESEVTRSGDIVTFRVCGDGFLYNMVRIMAGTLIFVNRGKIKPDQMKEIILSKDRTKAGTTAPAHGLYLNKVFY